MAIDNAPSTVATNALSALDFTSLIGGPMDAIIKAQALAAQTTYEFIKEVGLTTNKDGETVPVNVTFQYNSNGKLTTLTVPLIAILTIPSIEVTSFVIDFIANISASSSSTTETSSDTSLGVDASAEASLGIGPFSIKVKAKANYSSKQHSKAAQESKYSVEYTMNVRVEGGQSPMPAGLQTVLNILQSNTSAVSEDDLLKPAKPYLDIDLKNNDYGYIEMILKDPQGMLLQGQEVVFDYPTDLFDAQIIKGYDESTLDIAMTYVSKSRYSLEKGTSSIMPEYVIPKKVLKSYVRKDTFRFNVDSGLTVFTDNHGVAQIKFTVKEGIDSDTQGVISIRSQIIPPPELPESIQIPFTILKPALPSASLVMKLATDDLKFTSTNDEKTLKVTLVDPQRSDEPIPNESVSCKLIGDAASFYKLDNESGTTDSEGKIDFKVTLITAPGSDKVSKLKLNNVNALNKEVELDYTAPLMKERKKNKK